MSRYETCPECRGTGTDGRANEGVPESCHYCGGSGKISTTPQKIEIKEYKNPELDRLIREGQKGKGCMIIFLITVISGMIYHILLN